MDAKLTLKLDKNVIDKAKEYASSHKRSLSRLIESYLRTLIEKIHHLIMILKFHHSSGVCERV